MSRRELYEIKGPRCALTRLSVVSTLRHRTRGNRSIRARIIRDDASVDFASVVTIDERAEARGTTVKQYRLVDFARNRNRGCLSRRYRRIRARVRRSRGFICHVCVVDRRFT